MKELGQCEYCDWVFETPGQAIAHEIDCPWNPAIPFSKDKVQAAIDQTDWTQTTEARKALDRLSKMLLTNLSKGEQCGQTPAELAQIVTMMDKAKAKAKEACSEE